MRALALLAMLPAIAYAGPDEKGLRVGAGYFGIKKEDMGPQGTPNASNGIYRTVGVSFGSFVTFRGTPNVALQLEVTLSDKFLSKEVCNPAPCVDVGSFSLLYLEAPILLRLDLLPAKTKFHFDVGPDLVLSLGGTVKDPMTGTTKLDMTPANLGVVAGAGFEIGAGAGSVTLDVRFKAWFVPLTNNADESQRLKSTAQLVLEVGYAFP